MTIPNVDQLPSIALERRDDLPELSCIYFAIDSNGVIQYIGRTRSLYNRWRNHHRYQQLSEMSGVRIAYLETAEELLDEVEEALIEHFDPALNGADIVNKQSKKVETKVINMNFPISLEKELQEFYPHTDNMTQIIVMCLTNYIKERKALL